MFALNNTNQAFEFCSNQASTVSPTLSPAAKPTLRVAVHGLSDKERTVIGVATRLLAAHDIDAELVDSLDQACLHIVSGDTTTGMGAQDKAFRLYVTDEADNDATIGRPLMVQHVLNKFLDIINSKKQQLAPSATAPAAATVLPFKAKDETSLLGIIASALLNRTLVSIEGSNGSVIFMHGPSRYVYSRMDLAAFDTLAQDKSVTYKTSELTESHFMQGSKGLKGTNIDNLLWRIAYFESHGRLLANDLEYRPARLKAWPRLPATHVRQDFIRIATLMSRKAMTLVEASKAASIDLTQAIVFYNTAHALNLFEFAAASDYNSGKQYVEKTGLLAKIARHLSLKKRSNA